MRRLIILLLAGLPVSGCRGFLLPEACTLIGCSDSLEIHLSGRPTPPFRMEVQIPGAPEVRVFECPVAGVCPSTFHIDRVNPERVRITITTAAGVTLFDAEPVYATVRPNGPRCEPTCRVGRVTLTLP